MSTELCDVAKQGYVRIRSRRLGLWQRRWLILRRRSSSSAAAHKLNSSGGPRLEKFYNETSAKCTNPSAANGLSANSTSNSTSDISQSGANLCDFTSRRGRRLVKVCLLTNVTTITRIPSHHRPSHGFQISFSDGTSKRFAVDSDLEADNWVNALIQEVLTPAGRHGISSGEPDLISGGMQRELAEQFPVYLMPTPKLDLFGECLLQVTHENIYLWGDGSGSEVSKQRLAAWPLTALRRYGSDPSKFTFEAGRHCATGEGLFIFHTQEGEMIYRKVHQATLAIAEAHHKSKVKIGGGPGGPPAVPPPRLSTPTPTAIVHPCPGTAISGGSQSQSQFTNHYGVDHHLPITLIQECEPQTV